MDKQEKIEKIIDATEKLTNKIWEKYGGSISVNAKHTEVTVDPVTMLGARVNPEIIKSLLQNFLTRLKEKEVLDGTVFFAPDKITIFDLEKQPLYYVTSKKMIHKIANLPMQKIGKVLANTFSKDKTPYIEEKKLYTFADVIKGVVDFLTARGYKTCKNPMKEMLEIINRESLDQISSAEKAA